MYARHNNKPFIHTQSGSFLLSWMQPLNVNQAVIAKCNVNWAVLAVPCWLVCLSWPAVCFVGAAIFYSCWLPVFLLLVSVYLQITPCLLVCMLHSNSFFVSVLNKHLSETGAAEQMRIQHIFTQSRISQKRLFGFTFFLRF